MLIKLFVGSRASSEGFSPVSPVFLSPEKTSSKFTFDLDKGPALRPAGADVASSLNRVI